MSVNRMMSKGNIGKVEVHKKDTDEQFVTGSICANEYMGKDDDGKPRYVDQWFDFIAFKGMGKLLISRGLKKGDFVELEGPMRSRPRKNEETGVTYPNWSIIVEGLEILKSKPAEAEAQAQA